MGLKRKAGAGRTFALRANEGAYAPAAAKPQRCAPLPQLLVSAAGSEGTLCMHKACISRTLPCKNMKYPL